MERISDNEMREILSSINFVERYRSLYVQYDFSVVVDNLILNGDNT